MDLPSLAFTASTAFTPSKANTTSLGKGKGKSELNHQSDSDKNISDSMQPGASDFLKQDKAALQRSQKPLQKNPFTTYRDPDTGRWMVQFNKR